ncbi:MAG: tRNA-guanine transglycosylase, partial [bacterium]
MAEGFGLEVVARSGLARRGRLTTPHGVVDTPAFMPVATYGAVRGISAAELAEAGAQILLSNTYHLHERPGEEIIRDLGGLHGFTGWRGPWLTDSGGFQVTSLADRARLDEEGVTFASPLDGRRRQLTPENVIRIQEALGSDIAMVLDQCIPIEGGSEDRTDRQRIESAMRRTLRWAERSLKARRHPSQAVFAIVQGGASESLRRASAEATAQLEFEGYAHGGLGLGESRAERRAAVGV